LPRSKGIEELSYAIETLRLGGMYRYMGRPKQVLISKERDIVKYFDMWNGHSSVFISVNSFPLIGFDNLLRPSPGSIRLERIFMDIDTTNGKSVIRHYRALRKIFDNIVVVFSGRKGYHFHIPIKRVEYKIDRDFYSIYKKMRYVVKALYRVGPKLGEGLDLGASSDMRRIARLPPSMYFDKDGMPNERFCVIIKPDRIGAEGLGKEPVNDYVEVDENPWTLEGLYDMLHEKYGELRGDYEMDDKSLQAVDIRNVKGLSRVYMDIYREKYPCLAMHLLSNSNPLHIARLSFGVFLYRMFVWRYGREESLKLVDKIYVDLAKNVGYVDVDNEKERMKNIRSLANLHNPPNCTTIKMNGLCIGRRCPRYKED